MPGLALQDPPDTTPEPDPTPEPTPEPEPQPEGGASSVVESHAG